MVRQRGVIPRLTATGPAPASAPSRTGHGFLTCARRVPRATAPDPRAVVRARVHARSVAAGRSGRQDRSRSGSDMGPRRCPSADRSPPGFRCAGDGAGGGHPLDALRDRSGSRARPPSCGFPVSGCPDGVAQTTGVPAKTTSRPWRMVGTSTDGGWRSRCGSQFALHGRSRGRPGPRPRERDRGAGGPVRSGHDVAARVRNAAG